MSNLSSANVDVDVVINNNYSITGSGQQLMSPVKSDLFGDKPTKMKVSDLIAPFKPFKKNRKETKKSAATQLMEKEELVTTFNEIIEVTNGNHQESNTQLIQLYNAGVTAAVKSQKQYKQAASLTANIVKLEKKVVGLENKLTAKTQSVNKLTNENATLKEKKKSAEENTRVQKEAFCNSQKFMKEANALVMNENKQKSASMKKMEAENEKLRKENCKGSKL